MWMSNEFLEKKVMSFRLLLFFLKYFSYFSTKTYVAGAQKNRLIVVGTQKNRLSETVLFSTHNKC